MFKCSIFGSTLGAAIVCTGALIRRCEVCGSFGKACVLCVVDVYESPVPGRPTVVRVPLLPPNVTWAPRPPTLMLAPDLLKLSRMPGKRRTERRNRKNPIPFHPNPAYDNEHGRGCSASRLSPAAIRAADDPWSNQRVTLTRIVLAGHDSRFNRHCCRIVGVRR